MTYASWVSGLSLFQVHSLPVSCQRASWRRQGRSSRGPKSERRGPGDAARTAGAITAHTANSRSQITFVMFLPRGCLDDRGARTILVRVRLERHVGHSTPADRHALVRHDRAWG